MTYLVLIPGKKRYPLSGKFRRRISGDAIIPTIDGSDVDQRAVITDESGKEVYSPRTNMDGLAPEILLWMIENPTWAT